jgi:hypothetical protein
MISGLPNAANRAVYKIVELDQPVRHAPRHGGCG